jgi:hypothetical protein
MVARRVLREQLQLTKGGRAGGALEVEAARGRRGHGVAGSHLERGLELGVAQEQGGHVLLELRDALLVPPEGLRKRSIEKGFLQSGEARRELRHFFFLVLRGGKESE